MRRRVSCREAQLVKVSPRRGEMFIDREAKPFRLRSEERNVSGVMKFALNSVLRTEWVQGITFLPINISLLRSEDAWLEPTACALTEAYPQSRSSHFDHSQYDVFLPSFLAAFVPLCLTKIAAAFARLSSNPHLTQPDAGDYGILKFPAE
jgi:hypothetical protein